MIEQNCPRCDKRLRLSLASWGRNLNGTCPVRGCGATYEIPIPPNVQYTHNPMVDQISHMPECCCVHELEVAHWVERAKWNSPRKVDTELRVMRTVHTPLGRRTPARSDGVDRCRTPRCTRRAPPAPPHAWRSR